MFDASSSPYKSYDTDPRLAGHPDQRPPAASKAAPEQLVRCGHYAFEFGAFRLFPSRRLLLRDNERLQIGGRAFDLLTILVECAGEVVSKYELLARVWPEVHVVPANLKTQLCELRHKLGDGQSERRFIATVSCRGYMFVAPVRLLSVPVPNPGLARVTVPLSLMG